MIALRSLGGCVAVFAHRSRPRFPALISGVAVAPDRTTPGARQEVVQPGGEVTDLRTEVTGVTAADLEGVTATRDVVRAAVLDAIRRLAATGRQVGDCPGPNLAHPPCDLSAHHHGADCGTTAGVLHIDDD